MHTQWSWWIEQSDWFAISEYDVIFTVLGGEYKVKRNRCRELGVLPKSLSKNFWKIWENLTLDDFEGKKRLHGGKSAWTIAMWFTLADFLHTRINVFLFYLFDFFFICHTIITKNKEKKRRKEVARRPNKNYRSWWEVRSPRTTD